MVRRRNTLSNLSETINLFQTIESNGAAQSNCNLNFHPFEPNNNFIMRRSTSREQELTNGRTRSTTAQPSYVPSYVRRLSLDDKRKSNSDFLKTSRRRSTSALYPNSIGSREMSGFNEQDVKIGLRGKLDLLREKHQADSIPEVHVKSAVKAMEDRINATDTSVTSRTSPNKSALSPKPKPAPKPIFRPKPPDNNKKAQEKSKHRRSLSDPSNMSKIVQQMKQLWNQKAEPDKPSLTNGSCSNSSSSLNSIESSKSLDRKGFTRESNERNPKKIRPPGVVVVPPSQSPRKLSDHKYPIIPPRPKGRKIMRSRAATEGTLDVTISNHTSSEMASSDSENLSVNEKALLFGGAKRRSIHREEKELATQPDNGSPSFKRHLVRSWSDNSTNQLVESEKTKQDKEHIYDEVPYTLKNNESDIAVTCNAISLTESEDQEEKSASSLEASQKEELTTRREAKKQEITYKPYQETSETEKTYTSRMEAVEEENRLVSDLRMNAKVAKERRRRDKVTDSPTPNTDDEDEDFVLRNGSFLHNVRRRSKDTCKTTVKDQNSPVKSQMAVRKTEDTIFGSYATPPPSSSSKDPEVKGRKRSSSLHKFMEQMYFSSPMVNLNTRSGSIDSTIFRKNSTDCLDNSTTTSSVPLRPSKLALFPRERSHTEGDNHYSKNTSEKYHRKPERPDKINSALVNSHSLNNVSPSPDKHSSGFSDEELFPADSFQKLPLLQLSSSNEATAEDGALSQATQNETSSNHSQQQDSSSPRLGDLNVLDVYDKIAKEVVDGQEALQKLGRPPSEGSSVESVDSGFRNSLEVPHDPHEAHSNEWSDFDNSEEEENLLPTPTKHQAELPRAPSPSVPLKESNEVKLYNIAKELLSTEESYVAVLHLIDQVFHKQVREAAMTKHIMPEQVVNSIFSHVPAIYQFHSSFLLPQLSERIQNWESTPRIGDIMTKAGPFLKMYSLYVQSFDDAMNSIKLWSEKSTGFSSIIKNIQKSPECNCLTLQHHMLSPVQRVPRYRLLLEDYVKRLQEDAEDRSEAEKALKLITVAATHSNETMKKIENFHKLVNIFNGLTDINFDIVDVTRELIKEGKIIKISARNGEKYERYVYLFSDMLLCCTPTRRLQGKTYKVTAKIDLDGMKVSEVKNPTVANAFCVNGLQKSMEFASNTLEEKDSWVQAILTAIEERKDRMQTFRRGDSSQENPTSPICEQAPGSPLFPPSSPGFQNKEHLIDIEDADLGTRAPRWIKDHEVTMCMSCSKAFNRLYRRRHHCRACGRVVCSECSEHKISLQYDPGKPLKVCSSCHNVLTGRHQHDSTDGEKRGVLEVEADIVSENSVVADYLFLTENEKKRTWAKTWCVIPNNELCLYFYRAHQDVRAQMTMPLPGFEVIDIFFTEHKYCFKLKQARKIFLFASDDKECIDRWKYALAQGAKGEDLTREEVYRLGQPVERHECSSEESEDSLEEEETLKVQDKTSILENKSVEEKKESQEKSKENHYTDEKIKKAESEENYKNNEENLENVQPQENGESFLEYETTKTYDETSEEGGSQLEAKIEDKCVQPNEEHDIIEPIYEEIS